MHVDEYAQLAEQYLSRVQHEEYLHYAGLKPGLDTGRVAERFASLFTREAVQERLDATGDSDGRRLAEFAVNGYLERGLAPLDRQIAEAEATAQVECEGGVVPFRSACRQITLESDRERRKAWSRAIDDCLSRQNRLREERIAIRHALSQELGFTCYRDLCETVSGQPLSEHVQAAEAFLEESDRAYRVALVRALELAGIAPEEADADDVNWMMLRPRYVRPFRRDRLIRSARDTLRHLGIELSEQHNLRFDLEARPQKHPRPFCSPIVVPAEVVVVASPIDGLLSYLSFFHELGHAEHFCHISPELPPAQRVLGDVGVTEAFAFLWQHIVCNPEWMRLALEVSEMPHDFVEFVRLLDFWYFRRYAGKLIYEFELHGGSVGGAEVSSRYAQIMGRAVGVRVSPHAYLTDVDDRFYCVQYLRAWVMEANLRRMLQKRFGSSWFRSTEAGDWIRSLWRKGANLAAEQLGWSERAPLDTAVLKRRFVGKS